MRVPVLLLIAAAIGCSGRRERGPDPDGAREVVQRMFDAFAAGDCQTIRDSIGGELARALADEDCDHIVSEFGTLRGQIQSDGPDGRSPDVRLVRVRVAGNRNDSVLRVQAVDGRWLVVGM